MGIVRTLRTDKRPGSEYFAAQDGKYSLTVHFSLNNKNLFVTNFTVFVGSIAGIRLKDVSNRNWAPW